ncbi:MAG TPA: YhjD/YihY/BrkB family envelope integrity protein, partial [Promineifilum sp.]|nr:YhjD/YihY/BrkB family envelope integrity protein [Promineifilum sp.]
AGVTAALFLIGRIVLAIFLALSNTGSIYGAAGSLIILLLWIYYSAQLLLYGAEFTRLYALRHGQAIRPNRLSRMMAAEQRADLSTDDH